MRQQMTADAIRTKCWTFMLKNEPFMVYRHFWMMPGLWMFVWGLIVASSFRLNFSQIHCTTFGNYKLKKIHTVSGNIWVCGWVLGCLGAWVGLRSFCFANVSPQRTFSSNFLLVHVLFDCKILRHPASQGTGKCGTNIMCNLQPVRSCTTEADINKSKCTIHPYVYIPPPRICAPAQFPCHVFCW